MAIGIRGEVYFLDFCMSHVKCNDSGTPSDLGSAITEHVLEVLKKYEHEHLSKFLSAGLPQSLLERAPTLASRLWAEIDIVPIVLHVGEDYRCDKDQVKLQNHWECKDVDEQADSMARKAIG